MSWKVQKTRQTKRIENGEDYIMIQKLNQGDKDDLMDVMMKMDVSSLDQTKLKNGDASGAQLHLGAMRHFQRVRSIIEWNLRYDDGTPVPLTEESIKNLPPEIVTEIDAAIQELNLVSLSDAKKN
jgi:hypothetical protein